VAEAVSTAIRDAAGPELLTECRTLGGCKTGYAKITAGYRLPAKYVIHAVGPVWQGGEKDEDALLASCYRESLRLAREHDVRTIAFPAISCGAYRFPLQRAAQIAVDAIARELPTYEALQKVVVAAFDVSVERAFQTALQSLRLAR
jgi:O-acetyl-ADP-ribose deacetylase (regulator of RNase III)